MLTRDFNQFLDTSKIRTNMTNIQSNLYHNIGKYYESLPKGKQQFLNLEVTKNKANKLKKNAIENLHKNLLLFEEKITQNGAKVFWAETAKDVHNYIENIIQYKNAKKIVKSKSMVSEEIHLNEFLEKINIEVVETDLGEFIQQLDNEPPIHILTPAMHKSKEDVAKLFHEKLNVEENLNPKELTKVARNVLRQKYIKADIGITGANFILPDIGGIAITENEGNARITMGFPKIHIVIVGIEKVIPSVNDLSLFWPLLTTYGTGQFITSYSTVITGPKTLLEINGPEEMYVILLDNGRTNILKDEEKRESLYCIRCGACLNSCPVYKNLAGGHGYLTTYSGPIGSVISPQLKGLENLGHLSFASTLCGACTEVCPVKINLHTLLLKNRFQAVENNLFKYNQKIQWKIWSYIMRKPKYINLLNFKIKTFIVDNIFAINWTKVRSKIIFSRLSFSALYKKYKKTKSGTN